MSAEKASALRVREKTRPRESQLAMFTTFAVVMLVAVLVIGVVLALSYRADANRRGLAEGRAEAVLMAQTAIGPLLDGRPLSQGLSSAEQSSMHHLVSTAIRSHHVLRLRIRDLSGTIVFSNDGSGLHQSANSGNRDELQRAASGLIVARLTRLNADNAHGPFGPAVVEVYLPLRAGSLDHQVGILEAYLPYTPIRLDVNAGLHSLYQNLAVGLGALYLILFAISYVVGRKLRRQVKISAYLAEHDVLTDLPNRMLFHRRAKAALQRDQLNGRKTTIAIIDLDRFKEINDTLGHYNGDLLLSALSQVITTFLNDPNALARMGGDEFGILLSNVDEPEIVLRELREAIEHEITIAGLPLTVEASIGYATAPDHGSDVDDLLQLADVAMYVAKAHHRGVVCYDASQNHYDASNLALMAELRQAIDSDQLVLHYQPKTRIDDGRIVAVEALVRWQHPTQGLLYPDRFIPLAEQTDLIDRLTEWVIRNALGDLRRFGPDADELTLAVNISARNLGRTGFAERVVTALTDAGVAPIRLIVEVTETALMTDPIRAAFVLQDLDGAGVRVSIDDFGVGQTSLGYLSALPIYELKIDRSFITDMMHNRSHAAIVQSIVELGHNLGFLVVGEGVETDDVLTNLAATGCDVAQGYLFARPMPKERLTTWLSDHKMVRTG